MKPSKKDNGDKIKEEKIKLMQERQKRWMEQRTEGLLGRPSSGRQKGATGKPTKKGSEVGDNKREVFLWTSKNPDYPPEKFVVRNKNKKASSTRSEKSDRTTARSLAGRDFSEPVQSTFKAKEKHTASTPEKLETDLTMDRGFSEDMSSINSSDTVTDSINNFQKNNANYDRHKYSQQTVQSQLSSGLSDLEIVETIHKSAEKSAPIYAMHCCSSCKRLMNQKSSFPYLQNRTQV